MTVACPGLRDQSRIRPGSLTSRDVDAPIATAQPRQHLVGYRARMRGELVDADLLVEQRGKISAPRNILGQIGDIDCKQVHGNPARKWTAPARDHRLGAR